MVIALDLPKKHDKSWLVNGQNQWTWLFCFEFNRPPLSWCELPTSFGGLYSQRFLSLRFCRLDQLTALQISPVLVAVHLIHPHWAGFHSFPNFSSVIFFLYYSSWFHFMNTIWKHFMKYICIYILNKHYGSDWNSRSVAVFAGASFATDRPT